MKFIKSKFFFILNIIILFSVFTACSKAAPQTVSTKNEDKIKLIFVIPSADTTKLEAFKTFSNDIKTQLPDYDISFDFVKGDIQDYETKVKVLLSSNNTPDVFFSPGGSFSDELFSNNSVQPVEKYLDKLNFWDIVIPSVKSSGNIYAVPFDKVSYGVMEFNSDLFTQNNLKVPRNFIELQTAISTFKAKGIVPIALGGKDGEAVYTMIEGFACSIDPNISEKITKGKNKFSEAAFKESADKFKELMDMGAFGENAKSITDKDAANIFYSGKAAMYFTDSSNFPLSNEKLKGKCGVLPYPSIKKDAVENANIVCAFKSDCGLLLSSSSKHPVEAVKLAIEASKCYNRYLFEKQNNPSVIYLPDKLSWKIPNPPSSELQKFMQSLDNKKTTISSPLLTNINIKASKAILEDSSAFMTGLLSSDSYTKDLDKGLKLK